MTVTFDSLFSGVVGPLLVTLVLGASALVVPSIRWSRALTRETEIFNGLPPGTEREFWRERVEAQAARLRYHEQQVPMWERVVGWLMVAYLCLVVYMGLAGGLQFPSDGWGWAGAAAVSCGVLYAAVRTLLGLPFFNDSTPEMKAARRRVRLLKKTS